MKTYLRILSYSKGLTWYIPQYAIAVLLYAFFGVFNIVLLIPMFRVLFNQTDSSSTPLSVPSFDFNIISYGSDVFNFYFYQIMTTHGKMAVLIFVGGILVGAALLSNIFRYITLVLLAIIRTKLVERLRVDVFDKMLRQDIGFFTYERKGDIMSRTTNDIQQVEYTISDSLRVILQEPVQLIAYFIVLFIISPSLTLITLILIPLSAGLIASLAKRLKKSALLTQSSLANISNNVEEAISGIRLIKAFTAKNYITKKFNVEVSTYSKLNISMAKKFDLASPLSEFIGIMVVAGLLLIGGAMVLSHPQTLSAPAFIGFLLLFARVLQPAKNISNSLSSIQRGVASADRIFKIIDNKPSVKEKEDAIGIGEFKESIQFKNVSFKYTNQLVLKNISFDLKKGKSIALVGMSGGGKSTIVDLISRFYDPFIGEITIDGVNLKDCTLNSLRKNIGIVTQDSILFNDTILNNIAFGIENPSKEKVIYAAKIANAHEFIMETEKGYSSIVGEGGARLSGGQKQRLSIARAVMKNPSILILDEATSSLDSHAERQVQEAITNLMINRTSLIIAHRLSTIHNADEILVLDKGVILERGSHETLLKKEGVYKSLQEVQQLKRSQ